MPPVHGMHSGKHATSQINNIAHAYGRSIKPVRCPLPPLHSIQRLHNTRCQQHQQQTHHHRLIIAFGTAAAAEERSVSYEWSWQQKGRSHLPQADSVFDQQHPLPSQPNIQAIVVLLTAAAAACESQEAAAEVTDSTPHALPADSAVPAASLPASLPSQAWLQCVLTAAQPLLQQSSPAAACDLLQLLSRLDYTPSSNWMQDVLQAVCSRVAELKTQQLAGLVWSLSNLNHSLPQQQWQAVLTAAQGKLEGFYGPDLALLVCGAGSIFSSGNSSFDPEGGVRQQQAPDAATQADPPAAAPGMAESLDGASSSTGSISGSSQLSLPAGWADAVLSEVQYQVTEFPADLGAFDLARVASGLADLGISPSTQLQDKLMKAVYMRTRTIEEKGAVDFALAKLNAKGKKSMHFDPRWTHEELKWLPRRERDKRRIMKEGWYRTQWTGWQSSA